MELENIKEDIAKSVQVRISYLTIKGTHQGELKETVCFVENY